MSRYAFYSREEIIDKALEIVREQGYQALSARSLSRALKCSITPIFTTFKNMEEVFDCTLVAAKRYFASYLADVTEYVPAYKEFALRMIRMAREDTNLFLFLCENAEKANIPGPAVECLEAMCDAFEIDEKQKCLFVNQIWVFTCGLAAMSSKEQEYYTDDVVSEMISCQFLSTVFFFRSGKPIQNEIPRLRRGDEKFTLKVEGLE